MIELENQLLHAQLKEATGEEHEQHYEDFLGKSHAPSGVGPRP